MSSAGSELLPHNCCLVVGHSRVRSYSVDGIFPEIDLVPAFATSASSPRVNRPRVDEAQELGGASLAISKPRLRPASESRTDATNHSYAPGGRTTTCVTPESTVCVSTS